MSSKKTTNSTDPMQCAMMKDSKPAEKSEEKSAKKPERKIMSIISKIWKIFERSPKQPAEPTAEVPKEDEVRKDPPEREMPPFEVDKMSNKEVMDFINTNSDLIPPEKRLFVAPFILAEINKQINSLSLKVMKYAELEKRATMPPMSVMPPHLKCRPPSVVSTLIASRQTPNLSLKDVRKVTKGRVSHRKYLDYVAVVFED
ncbi:uncharacterized protein LOC108042956 [Drosophila rhopaloa]|uniref:Uncharacterized protein LOC108042956 n=1 Tax=Drosophila rhopaloa TaxID=1041015 RepID=A0A6P4EFJ1_DRORH|nr:uncharacterized protein LOC108042956 [Drosophila rhopaloa]